MWLFWILFFTSTFVSFKHAICLALNFIAQQLVHEILPWYNYVCIDHSTVSVQQTFCLKSLPKTTLFALRSNITYIGPPHMQCLRSYSCAITIPYIGIQYIISAWC